MKITMTPTSIKIEGHADYAEHGYDIVCSAISAVFWTAQSGLMQIAENYPDYIKLEMNEDEKNE